MILTKKNIRSYIIIYASKKRKRYKKQKINESYLGRKKSHHDKSPHCSQEIWNIIWNIKNDTNFTKETSQQRWNMGFEKCVEIGGFELRFYLEQVIS